jgi:hypothetical protein
MWVLKVFSHLEPRKNTKLLAATTNKSVSSVVGKIFRVTCSGVEGLGNVCTQISLGEIALSESKWNGGNFFDVMCFPWKG